MNYKNKILYLYGSLKRKETLHMVYDDLDDLKQEVRYYKKEDKRKGYKNNKNHYGPIYEIKIIKKVKNRLWK